MRSWVNRRARSFAWDRFATMVADSGRWVSNTEFLWSGEVPAREGSDMTAPVNRTQATPHQPRTGSVPCETGFLILLPLYELL